MKNIAIILAGGIGQRLGESIPKQFLKVAGKKVIEHTLDVFQNHPQIDEIAVVVHPHHISEVETLSIKNRHKAQRKAKFYINKCRSASCMQSGWKRTPA